VTSREAVLASKVKGALPLMMTCGTPSNALEATWVSGAAGRNFPSTDDIVKPSAMVAYLESAREKATHWLAIRSALEAGTPKTSVRTDASALK
jgi:hypothetical protein